MTKSEKPQSEQDKNKVSLVAHKPTELETFPYDAGTIRFLATSEDTSGAWAIVESREMPGYKTPLHWHDDLEEAIYVLEGVMTAKIADKTYEFPAGSYFVIPRGIIHAQGNLGTVPVKVLITVIPGGYEQFFKDRVELFKTVKPDNPEFLSRMREIGERHGNQVLGHWDAQK